MEPKEYLYNLFKNRNNILFDHSRVTFKQTIKGRIASTRQHSFTEEWHFD
jgi:hypothetical protein